MEFAPRLQSACARGDKRSERIAEEDSVRAGVGIHGAQAQSAGRQHVAQSGVNQANAFRRGQREAPRAREQIRAADVQRPVAVVQDDAMLAHGGDVRVEHARFGNAGPSRPNTRPSHRFASPTSNLLSWISIRSTVTALTDVVEVAAGNDHSLFVKRDGTVWAVGSNGLGQLGNTSAGAGSRVPLQVPGLNLN